MTTTISKWLQTGKAASELGVSPSTLRRHVSRGVLKEGRHYRTPGLYGNSPWLWDVVGIDALLRERRSLPDRHFPPRCGGGGLSS